MWKSTFVRVGSLLGLGVVAGCAVDVDAPEDTAQGESPIYVRQSTSLFTQNGWIVPVCFVTPGFTEAKARMQLAVGRSWETETFLYFQGWQDCVGTPSAATIPIEIIEDNFAGGHTAKPSRAWARASGARTCR